MIDQKREQLEKFIREQTLGPGAMGGRFIDLQDEAHWPMEGVELINTVPAGIYSTGVLFPVDNTERGGMGGAAIESEEAVRAPLTPGGPEDEGESEVEEEEVHVDEQSLNQMYPNTMGLTVCLDQSVAHDNDLQIIVSGRYYRKMDFKSSGKGVGVLLEQDKQVFTAFLAQLPADDIVRRQVRTGLLEDGTPYIQLVGHDIATQELRKRLYAIKKEMGEAITTGPPGGIRSLDKLKEKLFNDLRNNLEPGTDKGRDNIATLRRIEEFEDTLAHLLDLISIHDTSGYGIWKGQSFAVRVGEWLEIPTRFTGKHPYMHQSVDKLRNIQRFEYAKGRWASLGVNLQYSRYERDDKASENLYLKIQLQNTSKPFSEEDTKGGKNYFSVASEEVNRRCFFGVGIKVVSRHLSPYHSLDLSEKTHYDEDEVSRYIYRQFEDMGQGHGCSVAWGQEGDIPYVATEYIPIHDTPDVDPSPRPGYMDTQCLQFKWLSTLSPASDTDLIRGLRQFAEGYGKWIGTQQDANHPAIADQIREECRSDQKRMLENIDLLLSDAECMTCFRVMNSAMFMQLWHGEKAKWTEDMDQLIGTKDFQGFTEMFYQDNAHEDVFGHGEAAAWRPFQLAFILLNLDGIFPRPDDPDWKARNEWVDLVWFPTGGGKTEAYMGLIALTIIRRRRKFKEQGGGTVVMMRYTLRLLTTQQFQRASLLIMALELIRRWDKYELGKEPIYIGLFVGQGSLPNKLKKPPGNDRKREKSLEEEYEDLKAAQLANRTRKSKIPLRKCPWCGHDLNPVKYYDGDPRDVYMRNRIVLECSRPDDRCAFSTSRPFPSRQDQGPIPVSLCDEEIYQHPPALLFGTVDKFAQIAHKIATRDDKRAADSRRLFGKGNWENGKPALGYLPPDLIIQDELHLMMGPLGSAVALFESAIDQLCTRQANGKRVRPKVISSTATTRNTPLQIMALFDRRVNLFPKPGVNCDDSFFAFYKRRGVPNEDGSIHYLSKRKYMGILPTGRTQMWMQLRLTAILLTHRAVFEKEGLGAAGPFDDEAYLPDLVKAIDYYHTVLTYFNSLREVGKTESQLYSYLIKETRRVFNKVLRPGKLMHFLYTYESCFKNGELTGRLSGEEVVSEMGWASTRWDQHDRWAHGSPVQRGKTPPDLVIATNMISVGIDISRFNSMIMNCMPRNIAEYIQATSRVARDKAGLVITVHHPFRSRDISHYERFIEFHEKMYSYVEPISITPFTPKALERYLPLYIATMIRHHTSYVDRTDANNALDDHQIETMVGTLLQYFKDRMNHLQGMTEVSEAVKRLLTENDLVGIEQLIRQAIAEWQNEYRVAQRSGMALVFNNRAPAAKVPQQQLYVDINEYQDNIRTELWRIPQSLRVVEPEAVIHVSPK